jgi:hypothetical protein
LLQLPIVAVILTKQPHDENLAVISSYRERLTGGKVEAPLRQRRRRGAVAEIVLKS